MNYIETQLRSQCIYQVVITIICFTCPFVVYGQGTDCNNAIALDIGPEWKEVGPIHPYPNSTYYKFTPTSNGTLQICMKAWGFGILDDCPSSNYLDTEEVGICGEHISGGFAYLHEVELQLGTTYYFICTSIVDYSGPVDVKYYPYCDDCLNPSQLDSSINCQQVDRPVCGCDGNTYDNLCYAYYYGGVVEWTEGPCDTGCIREYQIDSTINCQQVDQPICGCDGMTYSNICHAYYYGGVSEWTDGPCDEECIDETQIDSSTNCQLVYDPVCGCDGNTYTNECFAMYYGGVSEWTPGTCDTACIDETQIDSSTNCQLVYEPVCGCDGVTYQNECFAIFYGGVTEWIEGECEGECIDETQIDSSTNCPFVYDPVCGCDEVTYQNECFAQFYGGVTDWIEGECETGIGLGVKEVPKSFQTIPNPAADRLMLKFNSAFNQNAIVYIRELTGKNLKTKEVPLGTKQITLDISKLSSAVYIWEIISENGEIKRSLFIKQ